jgi:hypothetical protein
MDLLTHLANARQAAKNNAAARKNTQLFRFDWRSTGWTFVVGYPAACSALGIKENTLRSRLSTTNNKYMLKRVNPIHGEYDALTVSAIPLAKVPAGVRGLVAREVDWERLGAEAPGYDAAVQAGKLAFPTGTTLAPPARTVPKQTNRRTREKPQSKLPK